MKPHLFLLAPFLIFISSISCLRKSPKDSEDIYLTYYKTEILRILGDVQSFNEIHGHFPESLNSREFQSFASTQTNSFLSDYSNPRHHEIWSFMNVNLRIDGQRIFFVLNNIFPSSSGPKFLICTKHGGAGLVDSSQLLYALDPSRIAGDPDAPDLHEQLTIEAEKIYDKRR